MMAAVNACAMPEGFAVGLSMTMQVLAQHVASAFPLVVWRGARQLVRCVSVRPVVQVFHGGETRQ